MKNILLLISMVFAGFVSKGKTADAEGLVAPQIAPLTSPNSIGISYIFITINDSNVGELGIEVEYTGGGQTKSLFLTPLSMTNYQINSLIGKTTYTIRARALGCSTSENCLNLGPWSNIIYSTTLVDTPPAVKLSNTYNCPNAVGLEWEVPTRSDEISSFIVQTSYDNSYFYDIGTLLPGSRNFTDYYSKPGINTTYRVFSVNSSGIRQSNEIKVNVKNFVGPDNPYNVRSDPNGKTQNQLTIRWDNPIEDYACGTNLRLTYYLMIKRPNETEYKLYKELYPSATWATIDDLKPKEEIDYRIFSFSNKYIQSSWIGGRDKTLGPPNPPSNLIGEAFKNTIGNSSLQLYWKDNADDDDYYELEYSLDSINFKSFGKIKAQYSTLVHSPVEEGIKYFYRAKAGNWLGESSYTPITYGIIYPYSEKPKTPYGLKATLAGPKIILKWYDDSDKELNYVIEKSIKDQMNFKEIAKLDRNSTTYSDVTGISGDKYFYRVKATNPVGESDYSNISDLVFNGTQGDLDNSISVFPNPSIDFFNINIPENLKTYPINISIFDESNHLLYSNNFENDNIAVDINQFKTGKYNLVIKSGDYLSTKKIIKY